MQLPYNIIYLITGISAAYLNWVRVHLDNKRMDMFAPHFFSLFTLTLFEVENCINNLKVKAKSTAFKDTEQRAIFNLNIEMFINYLI